MAATAAIVAALPVMLLAPWPWYFAGDVVAVVAFLSMVAGRRARP